MQAVLGTPRSTPRPRWLGALATLILVVTTSALVTVPLTTPAQAASPSLSVSPATYVGGQRLTWTGSVGAPGVRDLQLQLHMGRPGDRWTTVDGFRAQTRADGSFQFTYPAPGMFNIRYRVKAGKHVSASKLFLAKTQELTLRVSGQRENNTGEPALVAANRPFEVTVDTTPDNIFRSPSSQGLPVFPGRQLTLQRRVDGRWTPVGGVGTTSGRGYFTRTVRADKGTQLRLFDPSSRRASPTLVVT